MSIFSLVGSLYPSHNDLPYLERMVLTLDDSGIAALFLALPIFIITKILDRTIVKLSGFIVTEKGLFDPVTGHENISLRYESFMKLISNLENESIKSISYAIGKEYGELIKNKCSCDNLPDYISYWLETDKKAGFIENITIEGTKSVPIIKMNNSFAKRIKMRYASQDSTKICQFLEFYTAGVLGAFDGKQYSLMSDQCVECASNSECMLSTKTI